MFVFGKQYATNIGEICHNDLHQNVAYLIILGTTDDVTVVDKSGAHHTAPAILVKPMAEHSVAQSPNIACHIFLAPYSSFAARLRFAETLRKNDDESGIVELSTDALPFHSQMSGPEICGVLDDLVGGIDTNIDPRLCAMLADLDKAPFKSTLADIAVDYDLSPSRLRVLAKEQIGVPLSNLLLWRKLVMALEVLASGSILSEAAQAGGFSDQAHFSRTTRKMFGITPFSSTFTFN